MVAFAIDEALELSGCAQTSTSRPAEGLTSPESVDLPGRHLPAVRPITSSLVAERPWSTGPSRGCRRWLSLWFPSHDCNPRQHFKPLRYAYRNEHPHRTHWQTCNINSCKDSHLYATHRQMTQAWPWQFPRIGGRWQLGGLLARHDSSTFSLVGND